MINTLLKTLKNHDFVKKARSIAAKMLSFRREIHAYPELAFQEIRTAEFITKCLREIGIRKIKTGIAKTGVICDIGDEPGPVIALRADMDALPIQDGKNAVYASKIPGVMHACGHDAHVAILLGVAELLVEFFREHSISGGVRLLFQPAEESQDQEGFSGAPRMIQEKVLDKVDGIFALHVDSTKPLGKMLVCQGPFTAAVDTFSAWITAIGGHGAYPHDSRDPIWMLAPILTALHGIVARRINPLEPAVLSVCQVHGGSACNVIPHEVFLEGTLRSFSPKVRELLISEVESALTLTRPLGADYRLKILRGYPPTINHPEMTALLQESARTIPGIDEISELPMGMGSEDFSFFCEKVPGTMCQIGAAVGDGIHRPHHSPGFDISERVLPVGAALLADSAIRFLIRGIKK